MCLSAVNEPAVGLDHTSRQQRAPGRVSEGTGKKIWAEAGSCITKFTVACNDEQFQDWKRGLLRQKNKKNLS